ncbi:MAG TPA: sigma-70 family RNA polymerase sigma factor [Gemmatimonadaceae bacterium]|nr:sigma-70 family RNA polymerase sigma factor [Gemmatimonadaceae bacterium]
MPTTADLTRILAEHAADIEAVVRRYADDPMDRDDLRQEIAIAVWRAMPRFAGRATERTYVVRIAHNRAVTFCLRRARNRALMPGLSPDDQHAMTMSGEHERMHLADRLRDAMSRLPGMQREVLTLAADGHSPNEIARVTGRNAGAVRVALHRARATLREWLGLPGASR